MSNPQSASSIVTSISDFENLIQVCKRHGITALKLGDIEMQIPGDVKKDPEQYQRSEKPDINAEAFMTYRNL